MPNERTKSDNYSSFGGVNTKASIYLTGPNEVLASFNFDGSVIGDLTGRPGSTQYFSATFAGTGILGLTEYTKLNGYSKIIVAHPGGMWLGQDNSLTGISLGSLLNSQTNVINVPNVVGYQTIPSVTFGPRQWDFTTFVDHEFFCDGSAFLKFNGTTHTHWGLPDAFLPMNGISTFTIGFTTPSGAVAGSPTGGYYFAFSYVNERGFIGPARVFLKNINTNGVSKSLYMNITFPITGYGITAMAIYSYFAGSSFVDEFDTVRTNPPISNGVTGGNLEIIRPAADERFRLLAVVPVGATQIALTTTPFISTGDIPNQYVPFGQTNFIAAWNVSNIITVQENIEVPKILELYQDMLFWSGTTQNPSSIFFSDDSTAEPEGWIPGNEWEFRTNDGDVITALKSYGNRLMVGKQLSLHELTGSDLTTFNGREISTEYGILNNRACCVWEGRFWFLDRKGIAEYTGSLPQIVSDKITSIFKRMNLSAAIDQAQMAYMKNRNEVWTLIPIDGSNVNNLLIVYDTIGKGFYFWDGPNISILAKMIGTFGQDTSFYGDYSGRVNYFGTSLMGDNGSGFTSLVQFRYEHPRGGSVENFFRRLFVDAQSLASNATLSINYALRADYGTSQQVSGTMVLSSFQDVVNFGVPAKSLSVEISQFSATYSIKLHGYALESRWLRNT